MDLNWTEIGTMAGSFILGIGAVSAGIAKVLPTVKKVLSLATSTITFLNDIEKAIADDKLTPEEWDAVSLDAKLLSASWKAIWDK